MRSRKIGPVGILALGAVVAAAMATAWLRQGADNPEGDIADPAIAADAAELRRAVEERRSPAEIRDKEARVAKYGLAGLTPLFREAAQSTSAAMDGAVLEVVGMIDAAGKAEPFDSPGGAGLAQGEVARLFPTLGDRRDELKKELVNGIVREKGPSAYLLLRGLYESEKSPGVRKSIAGCIAASASSPDAARFSRDLAGGRFAAVPADEAEATRRMLEEKLRARDEIALIHGSAGSWNEELAVLDRVLTESASPGVKLEAARKLEEAGQPGAAAPIAREIRRLGATSEDRWLAENLVHCLVRMETPEAKEALRGILADGGSLALTAASVMGIAGTPRDAAILTDVLSGELSSDLRAAAENALAEIRARHP